MTSIVHACRIGKVRRWLLVGKVVRYEVWCSGCSFRQKRRNLDAARRTMARHEQGLDV